MKLIKQHQRGLTLVEVMVAIVIGLVLMGGVMQIFAGSKQAYRVQEAMSRVQENGRFALDLIARSIRSTAHFGCVSPSDGGTVNGNTGNATVNWLVANNGLLSINGGGNNSDMIIFGGATNTLLPVVNAAGTLPAPAVTLPNPINVTTTTGLGIGDWAVISDCEKGDIFTIANLSPTTITPNGGFEAYDSAATVYGFNFTVFALAPDAGTGIMGLQRLTSSGTAFNSEPLVEGVSNMQIRYGQDTSGNGAVDSYFDTNSAAGTDMAVRVSILVQSLQTNITQQPMTVDINGVNVTIPDRRYGQVFTTTIKLRNRGRWAGPLNG